MLLGLQNVTFEFGARVIVKDATWHIQPNERIGLIGYNGTGKSTLLKVLTNQYLPSSGTVEKGKETTIGFLHQDHFCKKHSHPPSTTEFFVRPL